MRHAAIAIVAFLAACAPGNQLYVMPPSGGGLIFPTKPIWLSGVREDPQSSPVDVTADYPERVAENHLKVVNAGYWLNFQNGEMQAIYEFTLSTTFSDRVYARAVLENPLDPKAPFTYEHELLPAEHFVKTIHGPLQGVHAGETYTLVFEVFSDPSRVTLLERVVQTLVASFDNTSGCVEPDERLRPILLAANDPAGQPIPTQKLSWPCKR